MSIFGRSEIDRERGIIVPCLLGFPKGFPTKQIYLLVTLLYLFVYLEICTILLVSSMFIKVELFYSTYDKTYFTLVLWGLRLESISDRLLT